MGSPGVGVVGEMARGDDLGPIASEALCVPSCSGRASLVS